MSVGAAVMWTCPRCERRLPLSESNPDSPVCLSCITTTTPPDDPLAVAYRKRAATPPRAQETQR